jgi:hypothetical protein
MSKFTDYLEAVSKQESPMKLISQAILKRKRGNTDIAEEWLDENSEFLNISNVKTLKDAEDLITRYVQSKEYRERQEKKYQ